MHIVLISICLLVSLTARADESRDVRAGTSTSIQSDARVATRADARVAGRSDTRATAHADAPKWQPITSAKQKECTTDSNCRILEGNSSFEILLSPTPSDGRLVLKEIQIKSLTSGETQSYNVTEMNSLELSDYFKLYKVQLRANGPWDLALAAYSSAREGPVFHYFVYDTAAKNFVQSDNTAPRLLRDKKAGTFRSEIQGMPYALNKDLKIVQIKK